MTAVVGGDRDEHGCLGSAGYVWSEVAGDCVRLFESGVRVQSLSGGDEAAYVVFAPDSSRVQLFFSDGRADVVLDRRALPSGGYAWNVEDDATMNVTLTQGLWTVSRRGRLLYVEMRDDPVLGEWRTSTYAGVLRSEDGVPVTCRLSVSSQEHSGDGFFRLSFTEDSIASGQGETAVYTGRRYTQRGMADDDDAVVWQLVSSDRRGVFNLLVEDTTRLVLLDESFSRKGSGQGDVLLLQNE